MCQMLWTDMQFVQLHVVLFKAGAHRNASVHNSEGACGEKDLGIHRKHLNLHILGLRENNRIGSTVLSAW